MMLNLRDQIKMRKQSKISNWDVFLLLLYCVAYCVKKYCCFALCWRSELTMLMEMELKI